MATAQPATLPEITKLPPGPIRRELHFNCHVGIRLKNPVHANFAADGEVESSGIDFSDYGRMQTATHSKLNSGRETEEAPLWVMDDTKLRAVIVHYVELRAGFRKPGIGGEVERLQCAQQKILATRPLHELSLTNLVREYAEMKRNGVDAETLQKRAIQIENLDTRLLHTENFAAKALMVVHLYYRMGWNSVQVSDDVRLKPTHIRQVLYRIRKVAWRLGLGEKPRIGSHGGCYRPAPLVPKANPREIRKQATLAKHVAILTKLAENNGGLIPASLWLQKNGFGGSYNFMLLHPEAFAHLQREIKPLKHRGTACRNPVRTKPVEVPKPIAPIQPVPLIKTDKRLLKREAIVSSPEFIALFEKARTRMLDPNRKTCAHGHPICAANAHVGDLRRIGRYQCDPCNRRIQSGYNEAHGR